MAMTDERVAFFRSDEAVHLLDTRPNRGASSWRPDRRRPLRAAVPVALGRHPMARAKLLPARLTDKRWTWAITGAPTSTR